MALPSSRAWLGDNGNGAPGGEPAGPVATPNEAGPYYERASQHAEGYRSAGGGFGDHGGADLTEADPGVDAGHRLVVGRQEDDLHPAAAAVRG
jgi:hypothetical protein